MALSVDTTFRDLVAYRMWNLTYAALATYQSDLIDGEGGLVLTQLKEYGGYFSLPSGGDAAPDEWLPWFVAETVWKIAATTHPDPARVRAFKLNRDEVRQQALESYSRKLNDYNPSSDAESFTFAFQNLRYFVILHTINQKPMLMPSVELVDAAIDWALKWVWNKGSWIYRRRQTIITITSGGTVSFDLAGDEVFDSIGSWRLYYTDEPFNGAPLRWATADEMAQMKAQDGTTTGRPDYFRIEATGDTYSWKFSPAPDANYSVRGEILVRPPLNPTSASDTTPFTLFVSDHLQHLRDLALAKVLYDHNSPDANTAYRKFTEVCQRIEADFAGYQDIGEVDNRGATADVYQDWTYLPSGGVFGGGM